MFHHCKWSKYLNLWVAGTKNRRPTEFEFKELSKQASKQREQLRCIEGRAVEKVVEVTGLQSGIDVAHAWLQRAQKAKELATEVSKFYPEVNISVSQEREIEKRAQVEYPDLAARVQSGEEKGELLQLFGRLENAQAKLAEILLQRTCRLQQELDAMESLLHFAKIDRDTLTRNLEVVRHSLAAKTTFLYHIHSLPDEVLCQILGLVVDEEFHDRKTMMMDTKNCFSCLDMVGAPLRLGAVSQGWRRIVESSPPLWRGIVVNFHGHDTDLEGFGANAKEERQLRQIEYYLSHSHGVDLDILIYVCAGTYKNSTLASVSSLFQPRVVRQIIVRAQHLSLQSGLDHEDTHSTLNRFLELLPTARIVNITPWEETGEEEATEPTFFLSCNWLGGCESFTCFGLHPLLPTNGAPSVQHLSITRTSFKSGWNLGAILSGFPNLTHLEIDPTLKGHVSNFEVAPPPNPTTLESLIQVTASMTGLDDLNKIASDLNLPSLCHLTLLNSPSSHLSASTWATFVCGPYSPRLTVLEIFQPGDPLIDTHKLPALHTLKLHGSAVQPGLETLAASEGKLLPPNLKQIYLYDSGIDDQVVRKAKSQLIDNTKREIQIHPIS